MAGKQEAKPLSFKAIEMMKPGDKDKADIVRNRGLRVSCGTTGVKSFFNRYMSPVTGKLAQVKIGNFPQTSLAAARLKLNELKLLRQEGRCPASELKQEKQLRAIEAEQVITVQGLVELYLTERIEDRKTKDGKIIPGARKKKGQDEVRRTLYADAVDKLGNRNAAEITCNDVITLINGIVARGAKVQAGNVLRELSLAYEFAIGLGRFDASFANPALLVKSSPLLPGGKYSSLEVFFKPAVLGVKYNGKSFDKSNEHDSATTFGKDRFANYIVSENRKLIDF